MKQNFASKSLVRVMDEKLKTTEGHFKVGVCIIGRTSGLSALSSLPQSLELPPLHTCGFMVFHISACNDFIILVSLYRRRALHLFLVSHRKEDILYIPLKL